MSRIVDSIESINARRDKGSAKLKSACSEEVSASSSSSDDEPAAGEGGSGGKGAKSLFKVDAIGSNASPNPFKPS